MSDEFGAEQDPLDHSDDEFEAELESAISDAYPILRDRVERAQFAGWHRRHGRAEDLANEATVRLIRHCRRHRQLPADPAGYLVKIARNLAKKQYATREKDPIVEASALPISLLDDQGRFPEDELDQESARLRAESRMELVRAGIEMLPPRQREAVELYLSEPGATQRELGLRMGISEDGFQKNLDRGIKAIRDLLDAHGLIGSFPAE